MIDLLHQEINKFCNVDKEKITTLYENKDFRQFISDLILTTNFDITDNLQAIDYLRSNDPTFENSMQLARPLDIPQKDISSVKLTSILNCFTISQAILKHFEQYHSDYKQSKLIN